MAAKNGTKNGSRRKTSRVVKPRRVRVLVVGGGSSLEKVRATGAEAIGIGLCDERAIDEARNADAVVLTGGGDVNPSLYGEPRHEETYGVNDTRDLVEMLVLEAAQKSGVPVLGICRGAQLMNVFRGGALLQHIAGTKRDRDPHWGHEHLVTAVEDSLLAKAWGATTKPGLSYHHQAISRVGANLRQVAEHGGIIEAIESTDGLAWLGVQFHPEMDRSGGPGQRIFDQLVREAARNRGIDVDPQAHRVAQSAAAKAAVTAQVRQMQRTVARRDEWQRRASANVRSSWVCFRCGIRFDARRDHLDHMDVLHGVKLG